MKLKAEIELELDTRPEPAREKRYPRFCGKKDKKYKDVTTLSRQIQIPQLKALPARYQNLHINKVHHCHNQVRKSLDVRVKLIPWQEYQVETIQRIRCTIKKVWRRNGPRLNDAV